jgi:hypothetical protein
VIAGAVIRGQSDDWPRQVFPRFICKRNSP